MENVIARMQKEISSKSITINSSIADDIEEVMNKNLKASPFMKVFWEQQKSSQNKGSGVCYHPMIIRFYLSIVSKSASVYNELCSSNVLTLPSLRTLRDYKNAIRPTTGFNMEVIEELCKTTGTLQSFQPFIVLSFEEMKIQQNLVFDKHSGDVIAYVDLGDPEKNFSTFDNEDDLATHVLVYYVRGLASELKFALEYFTTRNIYSLQIMSTFWEAISILEYTCNLPVIAAVPDRASQNRTFYRMHSGLNDHPDAGVVYKTVNLFAPDSYIYFIADAPHLMKTARNALYHSGIHKWF